MTERYCSWCGRRLIVSRVLTGFDRRTGDLRYQTRERCPMWDMPLWRRITGIYGGRGNPHTSTLGVMREEWR